MPDIWFVGYPVLDTGLTGYWKWYQINAVWIFPVFHRISPSWWSRAFLWLFNEKCFSALLPGLVDKVISLFQSIIFALNIWYINQENSKLDGLKLIPWSLYSSTKHPAWCATLKSLRVYLLFFGETDIGHYQCHYFCLVDYWQFLYLNLSLSPY